MLVSRHAKDRYKEFYPVFENMGRIRLDEHIIEHLGECRPVDDVEMAYIINSKNSRGRNQGGRNQILDKTVVKNRGVQHVIDRNNFVFVIGAESQGKPSTVITCYAAPYLEMIPSSILKDVLEKDKIIKIFQEVTKRCDSPMPWATAMISLSDNGFQVIMDNHERRFFTVKNAHGRLIVKYAASGKKAKKRFVVEEHFVKLQWVGGRTWCFNDFGMACADDFIDRFSSNSATDQK